jgi:hypothetical protein
MGVEVDLSLEERGDDRVRVIVTVAPRDPSGARVEGVAVQLVDTSDRELCPRVLLPVAGHLTGPLSMCVELRSTAPLAPGCRVVASAWAGDDASLATCPADPVACLAQHAAGTPDADAPPCDLEEVMLERLSDAELAALTLRLPFLNVAHHVRADASIIDGEASAADIISGLGLDPDAAAFLRDLLDEP